MTGITLALPAQITPDGKVLKGCMILALQDIEYQTEDYQEYGIKHTAQASQP